jgi:4-aminobutyrate aminotransferase
MILGCGETTIRLCPPLVVTEDEATVALDILEDVISEVEKELVGAEELALKA